MRTPGAALVVGCLMLASLTNCSRADDQIDYAGRWKLVAQTFGDIEFAVLNFADRDGTLAGEVVSAQPFLGQLAVSEFERRQGAVKFKLNSSAGQNSFQGKMLATGGRVGQALGVFYFRGNALPARLERTDADAVARIEPSPVTQKLFAARKREDPKQRVAEIEALLHEYPGQAQSQLYAALMQSAAEAQLSEQRVQAHVQKWLADAEPYGPVWLSECRLSALNALQGKGAYAALALSLAQDADRALAADASTEQQASTLEQLVAAAKAANRPELATAAQARLVKLEAVLDEEYLRTVPPFVPDKFTGRKDPANNQVVLMELFTGAQCPPCVAADVAFDALLKTYPTTDFVALQYHMHIPGPDPLTNPDSAARFAYYQGRGTPTTCFNGSVEAGGGGFMAASQTKYEQYRKIIDQQLEHPRAASIDLTAHRSGNTINVKIAVDAKNYTTSKGTAQLAAAGRAAEATEQRREERAAGNPAAAGADARPALPPAPKLRLRLALTEESVRYVGGNRLRFHHHVVRNMPGGADGTELVDGQLSTALSIKLDEVRNSLAQYLRDYAVTASFPKLVPEIELNDLSLVAYVQDDSTKAILHAVAVKLKDEK